MNRAAAAKSLGVATTVLATSNLAAKDLGMAYGVGGEDKCVAGDKLINICLAVAHGAVFLNYCPNLYGTQARNISPEVFIGR
ncbi:MAG TPA: hypothetical protein VJM12_00805 [Pyrinomonadaceae bacterium]|nr:hypothetical protein [Pyrinomonadaceae bacterium]